MAIESGQHDLVHLLLAGGCRPDLEPCSPLDLVLRDRRWDLLDLLLDAGAYPKAIDPDSVFNTYSREVMERFWLLGVDLAGDGAMAAALAHGTRNRPLYGFAKNHADDPRIQQELNVALGYAIGRKNEKAVSLCLWAGAKPRHPVPALSDEHIYSEDWTMTAFERSVWEGVPEYLKKLGFDSRLDDIESLYDVAYRFSDVETLARIQPPSDWHPIAERFLDRLTFPIDLYAGTRWGATWELEQVFRLGGHLRELSDLARRRLWKHLKELSPERAKRLLQLLEKNSAPEAFRALVAHPMFIESYRNWGIKKKVIQELAHGLGGSKAAAAKARGVLRQEQDRPPSMRVPWNKTAHVRLSREELHELVWSTPMVKASQRYGLSDNGLRKICKKLNVPTPPRGYWARSDQSIRRKRLPSPREGWPTEAWLPKPSSQ